VLVEFSIIPIAGDGSMSDEIAEALRIVDRSGLPYQLTPSGTCVEGEWEEVMGLIHQCHEQARRTSRHVITTIKIEDEEGGRNKLRDNVVSIEEKVGRRLQRIPS
jgi:uncharacterized protein (TIGR00106 family)